MKAFLRAIVLFGVVFAVCVAVGRLYIKHLQAQGPVDTVELFAGWLILSAVVAAVAVVVLLIGRHLRRVDRRRRRWLDAETRAAARRPPAASERWPYPLPQAHRRRRRAPHPSIF